MALFITFEGGEGSGKSSQAGALYRRLCRLSVPAILVHEPGSTPLGDRVSRLLKWSHGADISPVSQLMLFNASRAQLVSDVIRPALSEGKTVICDRYTDSTVAYQGYGGKLNLQDVISVNRIATDGLTPDLTVLLDIPVREGLARKKGKPPDRFERQDITFHEQVRHGYLELAKHEPERFLVVDARLDRTTISQSIWDRVSDLLGNQGNR